MSQEKISLKSSRRQYSCVTSSGGEYIEQTVGDSVSSVRVKDQGQSSVS